MLLTSEKLNALLDHLAIEADVYVPATVDGQTRFAPYEAGSTVDFGAAKTDFSPKELLLPQTETLYSYSKLGEDVSIQKVVNSTNQVVFGVRSCDVYSIDRMDEVFLTRGFVDTLYYERRAGTLIVALGCTAPDRACFCTSFGIDPAEARGADLQLTETDSGYYVEAFTEKGTQALQNWKAFLAREQGKGQEQAEGEKPESKPLDFSLVLDTSTVRESLETMFDSPYWNDLSLKCLNCGTCTFVCPTCYCFDMSQNNRGNEGYRFRSWDSCMFTDYTLMAGNHNPRPTKMKRLRNRFMHKLSFFDSRYGSSLCSGCGRCIEMCPVGIDITRIIEDSEKVAGND